MTLLTGDVRFGSLVRYHADRRAYLVVGFVDPAREFVEIDRPDAALKVHRHWLTVLCEPRPWRRRKLGRTDR